MSTTDAELQSFLESLLVRFDPEIDLSAGSPVQVQVIDKIVTRLSTSPFVMQLRPFIKVRLEQEFDGINVENGEPLADILVKAGEVLLDPIVREVEHIARQLSFKDSTVLSLEEASALAANHFTEQNLGGYSVGDVRVMFNIPRSQSFVASNIFTSDGGLQFLPKVPQSVTAEQMMLNRSGGLYYVDVSLRAEKAGSEYNVAAGSITSVAGVSGAVKVTNLYRFRDGAPADTAISLVSRARSSLSERSLNNKRGALARLLEDFDELQHLQAIGLGDPEMQRDIITGGDLGQVLMVGDDGYTADDGDGDGATPYLYNVAGGFIATFGSIGPVEDLSVEIEGVDRDVVAVVADDIVQLREVGSGPPTLGDAQTGLRYCFRRKSLTLSGIPGGIVQPNGPNGTVIIRNGEVHIGGCMDLYIRGTGTDAQKQLVESITDEMPLHEGVNLEVYAAGAPANLVQDMSVPPVDFLQRGVHPGMFLWILGGLAAGKYHIVKVMGNQLLVLDEAGQKLIAGGVHLSGLKYRIVDDIDSFLNEPKTFRGSGLDLVTTLGSKIVTTTSGLDFLSIGAVVGDVLRMSSPTMNVGDYEVDKVTGTGNIALLLKSPAKASTGTGHWTLFRKGAGMDMPMTRITGVSVLDSSQKPTGATVPPADPIDIRAGEFSNPGQGLRREVVDARVGIIGAVDLSAGVTIPGTGTRTLIILVDGTSFTFPLLGGAVYTAVALVGIINAVFPGVAALLTRDGAQYLTLRSRNRWIRVHPQGSANALLGFKVAFGFIPLEEEYEDNRQVTSATTPAWGPWSTIEKDVATLVTGASPGDYYIQRNTSLLYISGVDDAGKAVFPLPSIRATLRVGSRSLGTARCYFLEPTSFEVRGAYRQGALSESAHPPNHIFSPQPRTEPRRTIFSHDLYGDRKSLIHFTPDPTHKHQVIPGASEATPANLTVQAGTAMVTSSSAPTMGPGKFSRLAELDLLAREVAPGDEITITYHPLQGTQDLRAGQLDPFGTTIAYPTWVQGRTLDFRLENGGIRRVTFTASATTPTLIASQINAQLGVALAYIETDTVTSAEYLRLEADFSFELLSGGTANARFGLPAVTTNNDAPAAGTYTVLDVGYVSGATAYHNVMTLNATFTAGQAGPSQHFVIKRPGLQRVSSTEMQGNVEGGLYFADIELVSAGSGDVYNLTDNDLLTVVDHESDGWRLTPVDPNLTFSEYEKLWINISRRILEPGNSDRPDQMTTLVERNLEVAYEKSTLVEQVQAFALSELNRTLNANIIVRHLTPHYVYLDIAFSGGSSVSVVTTDLENLIQSLGSEDDLEVSAVSNIIKARGASALTMPLTLVAVVWDVDRKIRASRSQNAVRLNRMATFMVGNLLINRTAV